MKDVIGYLFKCMAIIAKRNILFQVETDDGKYIAGFTKNMKKIGKEDVKVDMYGAVIRDRPFKGGCDYVLALMGRDFSTVNLYLLRDTKVLRLL